MKDTEFNEAKQLYLEKYGDAIVTNNYLKIAFGPSIEFRVNRKFTLCGEFLYHRVNYTKTATVTDGADTTTISEQTRATLGRSGDAALREFEGERLTVQAVFCGRWRCAERFAHPNKQ